MRVNKLLTALVATTVIASAALAQQVRVTMTAYDAGGNPGGVLDPTTTATYRLYINIEAVGDWINQDPDPGFFSTIGFSIRLNPTIVDIGVPTSSGIVWLSSYTGGYSALIRPTPGVAFGVASGQTFNNGDGTYDLVFALASTGNDNSLPLENPFQSRYSGDRNLYVRVNGPAIAAMGGAYHPSFGRSEAQIAIKVNPRNETRDLESNYFFLVPEPASMIALGSGLVGLLALRRRRKA